MHILLDTNIIYNNWYFESTNFEKLLAYTSSRVIQLLLPKPVIDEVKKNFESEYQEHYSKVKEGFRKFLAYSDFLSFMSQVVDLAVDQKYSNFMQSFETMQGVSILPYPSISIEELARRSIQKQKPFTEKKNGQTGFFDSLIWYSIVEFMQALPEAELIIITGNRKDFCDNEDQTKLHHELQLDLEGLECNISVCNSLKEFFEKYGEALEKRLDQAGYVFNFEVHEEIIQDWLDSELYEHLPNLADVTFKGLGSYPRLRFDNDYYINGYGKVTNLKYITDETFGPKSVYLTVRFTSELTVDFYVDKSDFWAIGGDEPKKIPYYEDWNEWVYLVEDTFEGQFEAVIHYNPEIKKVLTIDIDPLEYGDD